jgi:hypothetical protein
MFLQQIHVNPDVSFGMSFDASHFLVHVTCSFAKV